MSRRSSPHAPDIVALYRDARRLDGKTFGAAAFAWLAGTLRFDRGLLLTSAAARPAYVDASFHGFADAAAMVASFKRVQHLDVLSPGTLAQPGRSRRQDSDAAELEAPRFAPLRSHLHRFGVRYSICIAVPVDGGEYVTMLVLARERYDDRFEDKDLARLDKLAPHVAEALAINRGLALLRSPAIGVNEFPVALIDHDGQFLHATAAFTRLYWQSLGVDSVVLDGACLAAIGRGEPHPLPGGLTVLGGADPVGWLLRIRPQQRADRLSAREREIAGHFADGQNYKAIAQRVGLAPATVRNHLRNIYAKLDIQHRVELIAAMTAPA